MVLEKAAQVGGEQCGPLVCRGEDGVACGRDAGEHEQPGDAGGAGALEVGVEPVPHGDRGAGTDPCRGLVEDLGQGFARGDRLDPGRLDDGPDEGTVPRGDAPVPGDRGVEVRGDVAGARGDGVGRLRQVAPAHVRGKSLDDGRGGVVGAVDDPEARLLECRAQPRSADGQHRCTRLEEVPEQERDGLGGGDDLLRVTGHVEAADLCGDLLRLPGGVVRHVQRTQPAARRVPDRFHVVGDRLRAEVDDPVEVVEGDVEDVDRWPRRDERGGHGRSSGAMSVKRSSCPCSASDGAGRSTPRDGGSDGGSGSGAVSGSEAGVEPASRSGTGVGSGTGAEVVCEPGSGEEAGVGSSSRPSGGVRSASGSGRGDGAGSDLVACAVSRSVSPSAGRSSGTSASASVGEPTAVAAGASFAAGTSAGSSTSSSSRSTTTRSGSGTYTPDSCRAAAASSSPPRASSRSASTSSSRLRGSPLRTDGNSFSTTSSAASCSPRSARAPLSTRVSSTVSATDSSRCFAAATTASARSGRPRPRSASASIAGWTSWPLSRRTVRTSRSASAYRPVA